MVKYMLFMSAILYIMKSLPYLCVVIMLNLRSKDGHTAC